MEITKQKLIIELKNLGLESRDFSILNDEKPDCFNLLENKTGNGYSVYYLDERGNYQYSQNFTVFCDAADYIKTLVKSLKY